MHEVSLHITPLWKELCTLVDYPDRLSFCMGQPFLNGERTDRIADIFLCASTILLFGFFMTQAMTNGEQTILVERTTCACVSLLEL